MTKPEHEKVNQTNARGIGDHASPLRTGDHASSLRIGGIPAHRLLINGLILLFAAFCVLFPLYRLFFAEKAENRRFQKALEEEYARNGGVQELTGSGTLEDPYRVRCKAELLYMKQLTDTVEEAVSDTYSIENDIDLTIGEGSRSVILGDCDYTFDGILLGNGHTISALAIDNPEGNAGLFKSLSGSVYDLNVEGTVSGMIAGGIAASLEPEGVIANCRADVDAAGDAAGCVAGYNYGTIINTVACRGNALAGDGTGETVCSFRKEGSMWLNVEDGQYYSTGDAAAAMNAAFGQISGKGARYLRSGSDLGFLTETAVIPEKCYLEVQTNSEDSDLTVGGFFSQREHRWIIPVPRNLLAGDEIAADIGDGLTADTGDGLTADTGDEIAADIGDGLTADTGDEIAADCRIVLEGTKGDRSTKADTAPNMGPVVMTADYGGCQVPVEICPYEGADTLYLQTAASDGLSYLQADKHHELPGTYTAYDETAGTESRGQFTALSGRGNDSFGTYEEWKNGYSLALSGRTSLLGMPENDDYVLLSGYRYESLLTYILERDWNRELDILDAYDYRLVQLYLDDEYRGLYMLTGSQEIDNGRFELVDSLAETEKINAGKLSDYPQVTEEREDGTTRIYYDIPNSPEDVSGGYLLEVDFKDYPDSRSRFISKQGTTITMKSNNYATKAQVDYAADLWQRFEDAVYSEDGYNDEGGYYADYMDLDSMADLCLIFEITEDTAISGSVYFFTDAGDGKLYAAPHWDVEHSFTKGKAAEEPSWFLDHKQEKYENEGAAFWKALMSHEDFLNLCADKWEEKFKPSVDLLLADTPEHHEGGLSSVEWYRQHYGELFAINDRRWLGEYNGKCDEIKSFLKNREEAFDGFMQQHLKQKN